MIRLSKMMAGAAIALLFVSAPHLSDVAGAEGRKASQVEGASFDTSFALKDNLKTFTGKEVYVHLRSGKTLQGYVKSVGDHFLHLEKLSGRDFYDALVRIDDISAIEARFRDIK